MRILFTFAGGSGHLDPLVPIARAGEAAGHIVAFTARAEIVPDAVHASPAAVRDAVSEVLGDPAYRSAAGRISDEIARLPGPEHAVGLIERLAGY